MLRLALLLTLLTTLTLADVTGSARVIDGDTIEVAGERIRLHGIDAPESHQASRRRGVTWLCGAEASRALRGLVGDEPVRCDERGRDRYGRLISVCWANGMDVNARMVATAVISPRGRRGLPLVRLVTFPRGLRADLTPKSAENGQSLEGGPAGPSSEHSIDEFGDDEDHDDEDRPRDHGVFDHRPSDRLQLGVV